MRVSLLALLALVLLTAPASRADTCVWTGANGFPWHTPTAWSCGRIPTAADDVTLSTFNNVPSTSAPIVAQSLAVSNGTTFTVSAGATVGAVLLASSASLVVDGPAAMVGTLVVNGSARILGSATVTVTGGLSLGTGTIGGGGSGGVLVLAPGSESTIAPGLGETASIQDHTLRNEGTLRWAARTLQVAIGGRVVNAGGALFEVSAENAMTTPGGTGAGFFDNLDGGTVRKTGEGTTTLGGQQGVAFSNDGLVEVAAGVLQLGNGLSAPISAGRFDVAAGATLRFSGNSTSPQPYTLAAGAVVTGAGVVELTGGAVVVQGALTAATVRVSEAGQLQVAAGSSTQPGALTISGGVVSGTGLDAGGLVTVAGPFVWSGGRVGFQGSVEVRAEGTTAIDGGEHVLLGGTVTVAGTGVWTAGDIRGGSVLAVAPGGTLTVSAEAAMVSPGGQGLGVFLNEGTVRKTGAGVTTIGGPQGFRVDNRGLVEVAEGMLQLDGTFGAPIPQTAGAFRLVGGAVAGPRPYVLEGGVLDGSGSMTAPVTVGSAGGSTAALVPGGEGGIGTLSLAALTLHSGAVVDVELGGVATGASDQVAVGGSVALTGTLRVRPAAGFGPSVGDRFPVVTCSGTCSGAFTALDLPDGLSGTVEMSPGAAEFVVSAFVAGEDALSVPTALALAAWPNPSAGSVRLGVSLPEAGAVRVIVHDALGRLVAVVADGPLAAGVHALAVDTRGWAPGVYVVRLATPTGGVTRTLTVVR